MKDMTIMQFKARIKEFTDQVTNVSWVSDGLDEVCAKAEAWDLLKLKLDGKNKSILTNKNASDEDLDFVHNNTAVLWEMGDLERSGPDGTHKS